jgi:hypothetical protein
MNITNSASNLPDLVNNSRLTEFCFGMAPLERIAYIAIETGYLEQYGKRKRDKLHYIYPGRGPAHLKMPERYCYSMVLNSPSSGLSSKMIICRHRPGYPDRRVLYIDIDVHHGDGAEEVFTSLIV